MTEKLFGTTVVGSYPQPGWLVNREALKGAGVPRIRAAEIWRVPPEFLEEAVDDATIVAIRDMERAGIDTITDGEIRRESYSNRFAMALDGIDADNPFEFKTPAGRITALPRIVGRIRRTAPVEVRDVEFLRRATDRAVKITLPGPFTIAQQARNEFYKDEEEMILDIAAALNEEALDLEAAGADVIQFDDPWVRNNPDGARLYAVKGLNRAVEGLTVTTAVHICFGYAALVTGKPTGYAFLPELAAAKVDQISIESAQPKIDLGVLADLRGKTIVLGAVDLSDPQVETPETVAARLRRALPYVAADRLIAAPDCGMKYLPRATAFGKLKAMSEGAALLRAEHAGTS